MRLKKDSREILIFAVYIILSVLLVGGSILYIESKKGVTADKGEVKHRYEDEEKGESEDVVSQAGIVELSDTYIRIPKMGNNASISLKNCYMDRVFDITISGWEKNELTISDISRFSGNNRYYGSCTNDGRDFVKKIIMEKSRKESPDLGVISLSLTLNHVYEPEILEDEEYFYILLKKPRQIYERIVVIDAGHGGSSSGTYSSSSIMYEKDVNLDVTLKLKQLLDELENKEEGRLKVYYTRLTDENIYLSPRVRLANDVEADAFISIHCNGNYDTSLYGAELMCAPVTGKHSPYSVELGNFCFDALLKMTGRFDRERYVLDDIYILNHSRVPACILEIGYLTHDKDRKYLEKEENRTKAAVGIFNGLTSYLDWRDNEERK